MPGKSRVRVAGIVAVPPPVTGMTVVTRRAVEALDDEFDHVRVTTISARDGQASWSWRLERQIRYLVHSLALPLVRARDADVLYLVSDSRWGLPRVLAQVGLCRLLGLPVVLHHHVARYATARSRMMATIASVGGDRVTHVLLCDRLRDAFHAHYRAPRTAVLGNDYLGEDDADGDVEPASGPVARGPLTFGVLSNLTVEKGVDTFCEVMDGLLAAGHDLRVMIAGPCKDPGARDAVDQLVRNHPTAVEYWGRVHGATKEEFLAALHVFVFPTRYENEAQPLVLFEALQAGVPVVAYDRGCIPEQVQDQGWVVADRASLQRVLTGVLHQPDLLVSRRAAIEDNRDSRRPWRTSLGQIIEAAARRD